MLSLYDSFLLISLCALGAMAPGVSLAVITRHTLHGGHRAGVVAAVAHAVAVGLWALATVAGLALLFRQHPLLEQLFGVFGAACLLWLAARSWRLSQLPPAELAPTPANLHGAAQDGFMVAFVNPRVALFFLALFSQFLSADVGTAARAQMVATATLVDGGWYALVAILLGRSRLLPWLRQHHHWLEKITALLMVLVAAGVLLEVAQPLFAHRVQLLAD